jgi:Uma2 family endonuclease
VGSFDEQRRSLQLERWLHPPRRLCPCSRCSRISLHRWNALTRTQHQSYAPISPEFVIEARSSSDRLINLEAKMEMWIANGAELAWLIDP